MLGAAGSACGAESRKAKTEKAEKAVPKGPSAPAAPASPAVFGALESGSALSTKNIDAYLKRFTREPHPMASAAQKSLARDMKALLESFGWKVQIQAFGTKRPNLRATKFGGSEKAAAPSEAIQGENVVAYLPGREPCTVIVGGHYDTKHFSQFRFVGANDGGSSTALQLELARVLGERKGETRARCGVQLVFFDGEEATLTEWDDGERALGITDNLHGSRAFASQLIKVKDGFVVQKAPLVGVFILDMIGHAQQNLFITAGSDDSLSTKLLSVKNRTTLSRVPMGIDDDHIPFARLGIPFVHVIDWTNLKEWHTEKDDLAIVSGAKIAHFGEMFLRFLVEKV